MLFRSDLDVSSFADTCGNGICEKHESYESCTKDCSSGSKDDFCDEVKDGICDPDCSSKTDIDCAEMKVGGVNASTNISTTIPKTSKQEQIPKETEAKPNYLTWILLILAVIVIILLFLFIKKRKENETVSSLRQYISDNIRRGFTLQQIKDTLFREGYTEREVDKAIKSI